MRSIAQEVTGERVASGEGGDISGRRYANVRTVSGMAAPRMASSISRSVVAHFGGGGGGGSLGGGITTTAPSFYTPFTTPSSFQIPTNRKEVYLWAQWWYDNEPKVAAGIEFYTDFPLSGFELECPNSMVKEFYEQLIKDLELPRIFPMISQEYHLRGDVFVLGSINCPVCHGLGKNKRTGKPCSHEGASWGKLAILNPDMVDLSPTMLGEDPLYYYMPDDQMRKVVQEQKPKHVYESIPEPVKQAVMTNQPIQFDPMCIYHFKRNATHWQPFGTSIIRRLFPTLAYKDKLRQAQWLVAERHILPIKIVKIGSDERPASDEDIQAVHEQLAQVALDPLLTLVTHHNFNLDYYGAAGKVLQLSNEYELINQDIIDGLMLNNAILNGEGPSYANAQVGLLTMAQRLERFRNEVKHWIEEKIFKPIAIWNGFTVEGKGGQTNYVYPTIKWDDLKLRDDSAKNQMLVQLQQMGIVSAQTVLEAFSIDYDQEVERIRLEQASQFVNAPSVANADMGNGYRGPLGPAPAGGAPPMGPGGEVPPAMPPAEGGGGGLQGPPGSGGMGQMPSMAQAEKVYRETVATTNDYAERVSYAFVEDLSRRYAETGFLSDLHKRFVESTAPITGRGDVGILPKELTDALPIESGPVGGGPFSIAMNNHAIYERRVANNERNDEVGQRFAAQSEAKPKVTLFTKLEQKLYNLMMASNIPLPLFAQYMAGPGAKYQLDAAFPTIRLGVEADSETYHASPEKVESDRRRDMELATQGWTILRFKESEIGERGQEVVSVIIDTVRRLMGRMQ
jgi:very-short-patch-repair endonuclease